MDAAFSLKLLALRSITREGRLASHHYFRFDGTLVAREEWNDWVDHYGLDALGAGGKEIR